MLFLRNLCITLATLYGQSSAKPPGHSQTRLNLYLVVYRAATTQAVPILKFLMSGLAHSRALTRQPPGQIYRFFRVPG